jgi:hypothetical protein
VPMLVSAGENSLHRDDVIDAQEWAVDIERQALTSDADGGRGQGGAGRGGGVITGASGRGAVYWGARKLFCGDAWAAATVDTLTT